MPFPALLPVPHAASGLPQGNLVQWYDFSDISTLWKTFTEGNNPCWSDQATADADLIAVANSLVPVPTSEDTLHIGGVAGRSPTLLINTPGLPRQCLDFDGSSDGLIYGQRTGGSQPYSDYLTVNAVTILLSFRLDTAPAVGDYAPLHSDSNYDIATVLRNTAGTVALEAYHRDAGGFDIIAGPTVSTGTNYVLMYRHDGTDFFVSLNGGTESTAASGVLTTLSNQSFYGFDIGGKFLNGKIGEIAWWDINLGSTARTQALDYFIARWV